MMKMTMPPARKGSIEALLHAEPCGNCYILFGEETNSIYFSGIYPLHIHAGEEVPETYPFGV